MMLKKNILIKLSLFIISIYLIWFLLPVARYYFNGYFVNIFMTILIFIWFIIISLLSKEGKLKFHICLIFFIINIFYYIIYYLLVSNGNLEEFIKMGIMYFFPILIFFAYYNLDDKTALNYLLKLILLLIVITLIPTLIEVLKDASSIREMAYFASYKLSNQVIKNKKNIGDFSFIYGLIFLIPILYYNCAFYDKRKKIYIFGILIICLTIFKASFSIAILLAMLALVLSFIFFGFKKLPKLKVIFIIILFLLCMYVYFFPNILINISQLIDNNFVSERLKEITNYILRNNMQNSDLFSRFSLYSESLITFKENLFWGIGGYYYYPNVNIGYHSQLFDDMARYGIFYFINTVFMIYEYKKFLCDFSINKSMSNLVVIEIILYSILLILNPIYICAWVSIILFLFLPILLYLERNKDEKNL